MPNICEKKCIASILQFCLSRFCNLWPSNVYDIISIFESDRPNPKDPTSCFILIIWKHDLPNSLYHVWMDNEHYKLWNIKKNIYFSICKKKTDCIPDILVWWHRSVILLDLQRYTNATVVKKPFMVFGQGLRDIGHNMQTTQKK